MMKVQNNPTRMLYTELQKAYTFFNARLFAGELPPCIITLQRRKNSYGYFSQNRFANIKTSAAVDEIAMNPEYFDTRPVKCVLATLVHEMAHLKQAHFGKPSRGGYHNAEWADFMEGVGLLPTHDGSKTGRRTGQTMTHLIKRGGPFSNAVKSLLKTGYQLSWADIYKSDTKKKETRAKFNCRKCGLNAWAKPRAALICGECNIKLGVVK